MKKYTITQGDTTTEVEAKTPMEALCKASIDSFRKIAIYITDTDIEVIAYKDKAKTCTTCGKPFIATTDPCWCSTEG